MTALILRWREVPPVLWRWRGPAAMASAITRRPPASIATIVGAPGEDAAQAIGFGWVGRFDAAEDLGGAVVVGAASFSAADSPARADAAPTSDAVFTINLNGSPWGSVTILAGQTTGAVALDTPDVADGDLIQFTAPASPDPTLRGLYVTLASAA